MRQRLGLIMAIVMASAPLAPPLVAWEDHATLALGAFADAGLDSLELRVTSLSDFVEANETGLAALLAELEAEYLATVEAYPPLPPSLSFAARGDVPPQQRLLWALRVNPDYRVRYYRKAAPGETDPSREEFSFSELAYVPYAYPDARFYRYEPGQTIDALAVLSSACDEPDYGLDIGLFEDNGSWYGREYGWGSQPFGNPGISYGSQAPFHMGFYNEGALVYAAAPATRRSYPAFRAVQFSRLSRFAFESGDAYWGYRFAGWSLHYVQDLTMPYHASIMPGSGPLYLVWVGLLDAMGIKGPYERVLKDVTDKHYLLELLQARLAYDLLRDGSVEAALVLALRGKGLSVDVLADEDLAARVAREAYAVGRRTDRVLGAMIKDRAAYDGIQAYYDVEGRDIFTIAHGPGTEPYADFEAYLSERFVAIGAYSRAWLERCRPIPAPACDCH